MTARTWRGAVRRADAEEYAEHIERTGFAEYAETAGTGAESEVRHYEVVAQT